MPQHEIKNCPKCNREFECKLGNITECHCNSITLSPEEQLLLGEKFTDCLCHECLVTMQTQYRTHRKLIFPD